MHKLFRTGLIAIGLLLFLNIFATRITVAQPGPLGEALKRMETNYQNLSSLTSAITMDKFNAQLGEHDVSEGSVIYIPQKGRDAAFKVDWTKPAKESLSVINKSYVIYRPNINTAYQGKVDKAQNSAKANSALAFLNMSKTQLKANYNIDYVGQENVSGNIATWHLLLTPKVATNYKTADLWVDKNGMPLQAKVTENNNDTTTILLTNPQKNVTVNANDIQIRPPKGTKIIQS